MNVSGLVWAVTLVGLTAVLAIDLLVIGRRPHVPSMRESGLWVTLYIGLALAFGAGLWISAGGETAGQFYTGWLTEYSLSVDNLFVFMLIMSRFAVPRAYQQKVLLIGIVLALVMRGGFIAAGAALISQFSWVFYIFGAFLIYTAVNLLRERDSDTEEFSENVLIRWSRRAFPVTRDFTSPKLMVVQNGRRMFTPMLIVMIAIGTTDLIFALDSIPAIFGITREPLPVFAANAFALPGLRALYLLIEGPLGRLVYLPLILAFICVKLIMLFLHEDVSPVVPEIPSA